MKKVEFYKAMIPVGKFEKCTGYAFTAGGIEFIAHKTNCDGWTVSHAATGIRVLTGLQECATRKEAVFYITTYPGMLEAVKKGLNQPRIIEAEKRMNEFLKGV